MDTKSRLRIAVIAACPFPYGRGTPIRIRHLAEQIAWRGHEVHVISYHLGDELNSAPYRVHRIRPVPWYGKYDAGPSLTKLLVLDPLLVGRVRSFLASGDIDIVHAHHYEGLLAARMAGFSRPPVLFDCHTTLESELPHYLRGIPGRLATALGRTLDRSLPKGADHVVAVSQPIRDRLVALGAVREDRISVVENGFDPELFEHVADPLRAAPDDRKLVVYAGNLASFQGVDNLLHSFRRVLQRCPTAVLVLATHSSFEPYEPLASKLGIRHAIEIVDGGIDRLPSLLASADVAVNPRLDCPGVSVKTLNYMSAGKAIVSFEGSGAYLRDGESALLVRGGDLDGFADAVVRLLEAPDLAGRLGRAAGKLAMDRSWQHSGEQLEAVYGELLCSRGRGSGPR